MLASQDRNWPEAPRVRLLLVDDEPDLLCALGEILTDRGYAVVSTGDGEAAVEIASLFRPQLVVSDFRLPGIDGVTTIQQIKKDCPRMRSILVSGYITAGTRQRAQDEAVGEVLQKPVSVPDLLDALEAVGCSAEKPS